MDMPYLSYRGVSFGADPELFIIDKKTKKVIPADTFLPSKNNKYNCNGGSMFFDGVQAEINIIPSSCREGFANNIRSVLSVLNHRINKSKIFKRYQLNATPSCEVDRASIMKADPECRIFGCDPSRNAYKKKNSISLDGEKHLIRYAGGHIHFGCGSFSDKEAKTLIRVLDKVVGIPATILDNEPESIRRRLYYGKAGEYRIQPHGIEYRTLSNFWMRSPMLMSLIFGLARVGWTLYQERQEDRIFKLVTDNRTQKIINNTNVEEARKVYNKFRPILTRVDGPMRDTNGIKYFEYLTRVGINKLFSKDLAIEWELGKSCGNFGPSRGWMLGMSKKLNANKDFQNFNLKR